ncbi:trigger factor [Undibacter mobilis]|uniref:Trigger factor n=1 Tax=Undibacter mobilis TaxID=2292256 RepID=A0A371B178_9BRAD|nr:trigger factor [Undibacter mobilis]RDV01292.1 trigger factor [Undibacter mobilis]
MQVTETLSDGLKREYAVSIPIAELASKVDARIAELKDKVKLNGFRPGKVPVSHIKKMYGRSAMAEVIEASVRDVNQKIVTDNNFKLAADPKVTLPTEEAEVEKLITGGADLNYTVGIEIVPEIKLGDFKTIKLEKPVAEVAEAEIDEALDRIAKQNTPFEAKAEGAKAASGDRVTIDFVGTIDGVAFQGGTGQDIAVDIGSGTFIPGFEEQLVGIAAGENRTVKATFPAAYANAELAGKAAEFAVTAKKIEAPGTVTLDDDFAKQLGLESLAKLRDAVKEQIGRDYQRMSRQKVKRALLDALDKMHKFELPPTLAEEEFNRVWSSVTEELKAENKTFEDENTTEEKAKEEYRGIAERRVRLGLVLAEIGDKNKITVGDEELSRAVAERARQFAGQEQRVWDYYRQNPEALASLRAPIYEEKVVDFLLELADVTEKKVSREDLMKEEDEAA